MTARRSVGFEKHLWRYHVLRIPSQNLHARSFCDYRGRRHRGCSQQSFLDDDGHRSPWLHHRHRLFKRPNKRRSEDDAARSTHAECRGGGPCEPILILGRSRDERTAIASWSAPPTASPEPTPWSSVTAGRCSSPPCRE